MIDVEIVWGIMVPSVASTQNGFVTDRISGNMNHGERMLGPKWIWQSIKSVTRVQTAVRFGPRARKIVARRLLYVGICSIEMA